jgi:hypothetical protein
MLLECALPCAPHLVHTASRTGDGAAAVWINQGLLTDKLDPGSRTQTPIDIRSWCDIEPGLVLRCRDLAPERGFFTPMQHELFRFYVRVWTERLQGCEDGSILVGCTKQARAHHIN